MTIMNHEKRNEEWCKKNDWGNTTENEIVTANDQVDNYAWRKETTNRVLLAIAKTLVDIRDELRELNEKGDK